MIDYEKLKIAHELCFDTDYFFEVEFGNKCGLGMITLYRVHADDKSFAKDIDDLIAKLKELRQVKSKYKIGDTIFWTDGHNEILHGLVDSVENSHEGIFYTVESWCVFEDDVYPSKESLIDAQIEYWIGLKHPNVPDYSICRMEEYQDHTEDNLEKVCKHTWIGGDAYKFCYHCKIPYPCEHEPSADIYLINPGQFKCKKCGEFYK